MQAAGPQRHYGVIHKLAFIKGSRLQATYQNEERDAGARLGLRNTPANLLCLWQTDERAQASRSERRFNCEIICIGRVVYQSVVYMRCLEARRDVQEALLLLYSCPCALPNLRFLFVSCALVGVQPSVT